MKKKPSTPRLQKEMADGHLDGPYARDTHRDGLGGEYARGEHSPRVRETKPGRRKVGKASE